MRRDRRGRLWAQDGRAMARPCWRGIYGPAAEILNEMGREIARQLVERAATMRANGLSDEEIRAVLIGG